MTRLDCDLSGKPAAQHGQERTGDGSIERKSRRQLHQQRAEPLAECCDLAEEGRQLAAGVGEFAHVRDLLRELHREAELRRHACRPPRVGLGLVRPIEGRIDLHRVEAARIPPQMAPGRLEAPGMLRRNAPSGGADPDHSPGCSEASRLVRDVVR